MSSGKEAADVSLRTTLKPGDIEAIVSLHSRIYSREYGFDQSFEAYVAGPLSEFARSSPSRGRVWIAEQEGRMVGCIAIVPSSPDTAQLRWFLVDPAARGFGLGKKLLGEAVSFCRACRYDSVMLWTVGALAAAAHLYQAIGFRKVEEKAGARWGVDVVEEKYELVLPRSA